MGLYLHKEENPLVREEPEALQAENPQAHQPKLGSLDGLPPEKAC